MHIRAASEDRDLAVIQPLYDASFPAPVPKAAHVIQNQRVHVAENDDGEVIGFCALYQSSSVWVAVVEAYRRRGVGRLLMQDVLEEAARLELPELTSKVSDTLATNAFCQRFAFKPFVYAVNLWLDLANWDASSLTPKLDQARQAGIQFVTYAELGDNPDNRQKLYSLNKALAATIPRDQPQEFANFETYIERRVTAKIMPHEGINIALDSDQWIGMSQLSLEDGYAFNQMTGVLPAYRGRGIGQALKLLTIRFAESNHYQIIRTFNDVSNQPMITVNENAGFRQAERFYLVRRKPI
jgi:GNAT superfamily N-acetyltransferase